MSRKKDEERAELIVDIAAMLGAKDNYQVAYRDDQLLVKVSHQEDDFFPASYFWVWCTRSHGGPRPNSSGGHGTISSSGEDSEELAESVQEIMKRAGKMGPPE